MPDRERFRSYVTFTELGGCAVTEEQVKEELRALPLDGVLGFLGKLSLTAVRDRSFYDPRVHADYLNRALVDDFPAQLPRVSSMYMSGCVAATNGRHLFIHQQNIAWLAHHAILECKRTKEMKKFTESFMTRCCRLLLIVNDFFADPEVDPSQSLLVARQFALAMLRIQQFLEFTASSSDAVLTLARQWLMFKKHLGDHFDFEALFEERVGVEFDEYFGVLTAIVVHFTHRLAADGNPWQASERLFADLEAGREVAELVLDRWAVTPEEYCRSAADFMQNNPLDGGAVDHFDYVPLQDKPAIMAKSGGFLIPVLPLMVEKAANEPYFLLADNNEFRVAMGDAFEDYAHGLLERVASSANDGDLEIFKSPELRRGQELSDSVLLLGSTLVVWEHKGGRVHSEFLRGSGGDRVLGPPDELLGRIATGDEVSLQELRDADRSLLTRGIWQIARNADDLVLWAEAETGRTIEQVFPIITYQGPVTVNAVTRLGYLNELIQRVDPIASTKWMPFQWAHIKDLEALAEIAEHNDDGLDLIELLEAKTTKARDESFGNFLHDCFNGYPIDRALMETGRDILMRTGKQFWPTKTAERNDGQRSSEE